MALAAALVASLDATGVWAGTGSTVVTLDVASATSIQAGGCAPRTPATDLGIVVVGGSNLTSATCDVVFGSTNDTATLRLAQTDGLDTAMVSTASTRSGRRGPSSSTVNDLERVDASTMWGIGGSGLAVTTDSGSSWTYPAYGVTSGGNAITSWSSTGGVYVGSNGGVRRTTDGTSWTPVTSGVITTLTDVDDAGPGAVWAVGSGGTIIRSSDGGATWVDQTDPLVTTLSLQSVSVVDANVAWAAGDQNIILRTTDAGDTWQVVHHVPGLSVLSAIVATSASEARAVGRTTCGGCATRRVTTDGGATWASYSGNDHASLSTDGAGRWYIVGGGGSVQVSTDGLQTITTAVDTTTPHNMADAEPMSGSVVVASGALGVMIQSLDGGVTWADRNPAGDRWLHAIDGSGTRWWAVGEAGRVTTSSTSGSTWTTPASGTSDDLLGVHVVDDDAMVAVGRGGRIVRTATGGASFSLPASGTTELLRSVSGAGDTVWAVGAAGTIIRSVDGGATWAPQASGTVQDLRDVSAVSELEAWASGAGSTVLRTTDGGANWVPAGAHGLGGTIVHVVALESGIAWIANGGSGNAYRRTRDGGATWTTVIGVSVYGAAGFDARSEMEAMIVAGNNRAFQTFDGGLTWSTAAAGGSASNTAVAYDATGRAFYADSLAGITQVVPSRAIFDHDPGSGAGWGDDQSSFGACLESIGGGAASDAGTWTVAAACTAADGPAWRAVPATTGAAGAVVARAPTATTGAVVRLRFGMRVALTQTPGTYVAPIRFEVVAPG